MFNYSLLPLLSQLFGMEEEQQQTGSQLDYKPGKVEHPPQYNGIFIEQKREKKRDFLAPFKGLPGKVVIVAR